MRHFILRSAAAVVSAALLGTLVLPGAQAASKTVVPEKFKAVNANQRVWIIPYGFRTHESAPTVFWAPVKLPVGTRITKLELYSWSNGVSTRTVHLMRSKLNKPFTLPDILMGIGATAANVLTNPPTISTTTTPFNGSSDLTVRRGYRYFIQASFTNSQAYINGVKVYYR